jgi:uncharacterized protein YukE
MTAKQGNKSKKNPDSVSQTKKDQTDSSRSKSASENQDMDEGQELDALLALLDIEDIDDVDLEAATEMIDHWHGVLQQSDDAEMKAIGETLKHLKKSLSNKKPKADEIAELMSQAGDQVDDAANTAKRGYKTKLHTLGKTLKQVSEELEDEEN